ncbi:MAG: sugar phosphotransferase, partial [Rhodococcus sp. (in: high G+C Gram-positive bacteria)]
MLRGFSARTNASGRVTITSTSAPHDIYLVPPEQETVDPVTGESPESKARLTDRTDVVPFAGRFALRITSTTPHQAMVEDLLFVRAALDDAGIRYLLVRGNDERPVIAVDHSARASLETTLVAACLREPFYAKTVDIKR